MMTISFLFLFLIIHHISFYDIKSQSFAIETLQCKDPDALGRISSNHQKNIQRYFLIIGGVGAGIGNFLVFFPSAYYYAMLTGREILIEDRSLLGEACRIIVCGYPHYNDIANTFPSILNPNTPMTRAKVYDFKEHINGHRNITETVVHADGFKFLSGWYLGCPFCEECIRKLTGCIDEDVSCHDRHALQRLIRGPFLPETVKSSNSIENRMIGVPQNFKHGLISLPHAYTPRFDVAIHLRCQFQNFEYLVGPEDSLWPQYVKEVDDFLSSSLIDQGIGLFKVIEERIMEELPYIQQQRKRRLQSIDELDYKHEHEVYSNINDDKIYIYLASDNERVKEEFTSYLYNHSNIVIMRIKNTDHIVHAKNLDYIKQQGNFTGLMDLLADWYFLTLSNYIFAWRRNTDILSTFAHSAQRLSGSIELSNQSAPPGLGIGTKGLQLFFRNSSPKWRFF